MPDSEGVVEWSTGPENSRLVRALVYCMLGAVIAEFVILIGILLLAAAFLYITLGPVRGVGVSLAAALLVGALALRKAVDFYAIWWDDWRAQAFRRVLQLRWIVVATALVTVFLVILALAWSFSAPLWVSLAISLGALLAAYILSDRGTFDPDSGILVDGDEWELDLTGVEIGRRFTIGPHSFVWITDVPEDSSTESGFYVLPTEVVDTFERGWRK